MIKMICDRCCEEIKEDKYYTINIYEYEFDAAPSNAAIDSYNTLTSALNSVSEGIFTKLNKNRHYCEKCKNDIQHYINKTF